MNHASVSFLSPKVRIRGMDVEYGVWFDAATIIYEEYAVEREY